MLISGPWYWLLDQIRTLGQHPAGGVVPFDHGGEPIEILRRELAAIGFDLLDWRERPRTGRGAAIGTRPLKKCTAVLWHQTATRSMGLEQSLGVPSHAIVHERTVILLHPIRAYMQHAGAANSFSIGVEIVCRAAGIEGDMRTVWTREGERARDVVREATDGQLAAARLLGDYYEAEAPIVASMYHRNSEESRVSDPGSRIAWGVGLRVAEAHGLQHGGPVVGSGKATPTAWGGALGEPYNWRARGY